MERKNSKENDRLKSRLFWLIGWEILLETVKGSFSGVTKLPISIRSNVQIVNIHAYQ